MIDVTIAKTHCLHHHLDLILLASIDCLHYGTKTIRVHHHWVICEALDIPPLNTFGLNSMIELLEESFMVTENVEDVIAFTKELEVLQDQMGLPLSS